jgi:membrane-associated phospholipid phosphatase
VFVLQPFQLLYKNHQMQSPLTDWYRVVLLAFVFILLGDSGLCAQSIDSPPYDRQSPDGIRPDNAFSFDTVRLFGDDTLYVFTAPCRWDGGDWLAFAGEAGIALGTTAFDRSIRNSVQAHRSASLDRFSRNFELLGSSLSFVVLAGFEGYHFMEQDRRSQEVFLDGLSASLIASGFIVPVLKYSVGRERPSDTGDPYRFHPFTNHNSFPSGHTAQAFAVATVIASHYPAWWVQVLAYGSASVVGYCRIEQNAHFTSDVFVGGLIGFSVARSVVAHNDTAKAPRATLVPYSDGRSSGILFTKTF